LSSTDPSTEAKASPSRFEKAAQDGALGVPKKLEDSDGSLTRETAKLYRSFMQSYVNRINNATYRVPIAGIRIGSAKYSRLAQINLKTRIITFSRFAIENVPERGRRYLVLHELAHVMEASHNKNFWRLVGQFEPDYKEIGMGLDQAFKQNVLSHEKTVRSLKRKARQTQGKPSQLNLPIFQMPQSLPGQAGGRGQRIEKGLAGSSIIWTPDHGYVEPGSQRFGLNRDPKELFFGSGDEDREEEAFAAYLDLKEQENAPTPCIFDANSAADIAQDLYVYEDEGDFDLIHGTISGGDF
jgi:Protein of unknown function DUF45